MYKNREQKLIYSYDGETLCIEAWGENALRVRAAKNRKFTGNDWALDRKDARPGEVRICLDKDAYGGAYADMYEGADESHGMIENGKIRAVVNAHGVTSFYHKNGQLLLKENFRRLEDETSMAIKVPGKGIPQRRRRELSDHCPLCGK